MADNLADALGPDDVKQSGTFDLWDALPDKARIGVAVEGVYKEVTLEVLRKQLAVGAAQNQAPTVKLSVSTQSLELGQDVVLMADAFDPDGSIVRVEFYLYADKIGEATASPYVLVNTPATVNTQTYSAKAYDNQGRSTQSEFVPVVVRKVGQVKPGPPTNVMAIAGDNAVTITASAPVNQGSSAVTNYQVFRNGQGFPLATSVALPYTDTTAVNGTPYFYELMAHNAAGDSVKSTPSNTVTPTAASFAASLTGPNDSSADGALTLTSGAQDVLGYNPVTGGDQTPKRMNVVVGGNTVAAVDFPAAYLGQSFFFLPDGGTVRYGTFADAAVIL